VGIRRDITIESFDSGVITNAAGQVELNLMQQDAVAFRITMRVGMLIVTPPGDSNYTGPRSPFALVLNSAAVGPVGIKEPVFPTPATAKSSGTVKNGNSRFCELTTQLADCDVIRLSPEHGRMAPDYIATVCAWFLGKGDQAHSNQ
jgi:hypothetical protein